ncbi:MAG: tryptophan synthase subunit alpha [Brevinematales bacterium]|jgi:tryptophan synthase alpha chain
MLEAYIRDLRKKKDILLMTHIVIGYPSLDASYKTVESMAAAGVDMIELQIPFSEPIADGPVILKANHAALDSGITVKECLDFAERAAKDFAIPFLFMSYYNIFFRFGVEKFTGEMASRGIKGSIVPDLPPEEGRLYIDSMKKNGLSPIFIYSPASEMERMKYISGFASGFIYCVSRKGVTGKSTEFSSEFEEYLGRCRKATKLPLAVGFGVKEKKDVDFLRGQGVDIAVIGTQSIRVYDEKGPQAVGEFISSLITSA